MKTHLNEQEFIGRAGDFLASRLGEGTQWDADTDLVESGILDSLMMIEFFFFLEELRNAPIDTEGFEIQSIASIRRAYQVVSKS